MQRWNWRFIPCLTFPFLLASLPAFAYHGISSYITDRTVTLKGVVLEFEFIDPHGLITFSAKDVNGKMRKWTAEIAPPAMLRRIEWDKKTIKPGDEITIIGYPARDGSNMLSVRTVSLPNGEQLNEAPK